MDSKRIMMIVLGLAALALLVFKLGPLVMPRSWRMKRMARQAGQPAPTPARRPAKAPRQAPASPAPSAPAAPAAPSVREADPSARSFEVSASGLDGAVEQVRYLREIMLSAYGVVSGKDDMHSPFMKYVAERKEEVKEATVVVDLSVSGILFDAERPLAIINGRVHGEGDRVENAVVRRITYSSVVFFDGENEFTVRLGE